MSNPRPRPENITPEELKAFVKKVMDAARKRPPPPDLVKWFKASGKITDRDLRRIMK